MHDLAPPRKTASRRDNAKRHTTPDTALEISTGRARDIAALYGLGFSFREIAEHYHVTPQAVSLLLERNRRKIEAIGGLPSMAALSTRAVSALHGIGITSPQQAEGKDVLEKLRRTRNCGVKTLAEISDWLAPAR
ncbi:MAG: hypothetical protein RIQ71_2213 [Verrucomicrobiota bacterium]|jgi:DNA-binding CsgD family transcriptional regulator